MITAISPIDGRYADKTKELSSYFSEFALIKYRIFVEIQYLMKLSGQISFRGSQKLKENKEAILELFTSFDIKEALKIKEIESITNHDIKAVEYYLKEKFDTMDLSDISEWIHFGLTSQDINNTAIPLSIKDFLTDVFYTQIYSLVHELKSMEEAWGNIPLLARTHGQPASPTTLGKEIGVFVSRLNVQVAHLSTVPINGKFGGATGNFNAHYVAYPSTDWHHFANEFLASLGLDRSKPTTQIEHYDNLAALFHNLQRINTILIDFSRDIWTYISMDYFKQATIQGEIGSSAMPHKVNPIDFENAEGNLGVANALFHHLAEKLPISRLQRDLTDSTVLRNTGVPFAHTLIAIKSLKKGLSKLRVQEDKISSDLSKNWMVVAEAIQTILRREGFPKPYEALKDLTRGVSNVTESEIHQFIHTLNVNEEVKMELLKITPFNYIGKAEKSF
ncbi:MAG: adenylosuccinate lyase [Saprospiraceae bacterium]|nr:adenylosuccinate lyase [Saprospiraceae bacterium]MDP4915822.1 adenylosuccinate lyase [Saprospiraceae bacterium]MDP5048055.1 adenylosuccinate lyase [Saprospiraceae bacterium]